MSGNGRIRVLVVDKDAPICRALAIALDKAGCEVLTATSGEAALVTLRDTHVDALVLDLWLPDVRGDALFHLATALQPHLRRQSMFTTADITERADILIRACGAPFVRKPFLLADVTDTVCALVPATRSAQA